MDIPAIISARFLAPSGSSEKARNSVEHRRTLSGLLTRSIQLDALGYFIISALLVLIGVLSFMLFNSVRPPDGWLFEREPIQLLALGFVSTLVFYLLEQHSRLRAELRRSVDTAHLARGEAERFANCLSSAHHAAEIMVAIAEDDGLQSVVDSIRSDFNVQACAIMAEEVIAAVAEAAPCDDVLAAFNQLALEVVGSGAPIGSYRVAHGGAAVAVPLRVFGRLRGVLCLWDPDPSGLPDVEGFHLLGRVVELGWESRLLYEGTNANAKSLCDLLVSLISERVRGYADSTAQLISMLERLNSSGAICAETLAEAKLAAVVRDAGLLVIPWGHDSAREVHAHIGAQFADAAGLPPSVVEAVDLHHEVLRGDGVARVGSVARVLNVCVARADSVVPSSVSDTPSTVADRSRPGRNPDVTSQLSARLRMILFPGGAASSRQPVLEPGRCPQPHSGSRTGADPV